MSIVMGSVWLTNIVIYPFFVWQTGSCLVYMR